MDVISARYFERNTINMNRFARARKDYASYYDDIEQLKLDSLQDIYFSKDVEYLSALPKVVDVISTIVAKPKISSKTEEVLMRAGLVSNVSPETFKRTLQDAELWKRKGISMSPEYVYTHLNENEIKIYENIFIVTLIDSIDSALKRYVTFYGNLVETFVGQAALSPVHTQVLAVLQKVDTLSRKLKRIKNTSFYKIIHKQCPPLKTVHPTNILLKERAYNICYKFYRTRRITEEQTAPYAFQTHYFALVLKGLKKLGFSLISNRALACDRTGNFSIQPLRFAVAQFYLDIQPYEQNRGLCLRVTHRFAKEQTANTSTHLLLYSMDAEEFSDIPKNTETLPFDTKAAISIWNLAYCKPEPKPIFRGAIEELSMVECWVRTKMDTLLASELYHTYCPICGSKSADFDYGHFTCSECGAKYATYQDIHHREHVWFINLTDESSSIARFAPIKKSKLNTLETQKVTLWKMKQKFPTKTK